jgi:ElaA protein
VIAASSSSRPTRLGPAAAPALRWTWARFERLSLDDLYDALALRCRVFVLEQGPYLDPDGLDRHCWHLLGRDAASGLLHAYARIVDAGLKFGEPSLGRVITSPQTRGSGLGHALVAEALRRTDATLAGAANRISAQAHLERFYASHGYVAIGEPYLEDNIPHLEMLRPPQRTGDLD